MNKSQDLTPKSKTLDLENADEQLENLRYSDKSDKSIDL